MLCSAENPTGALFLLKTFPRPFEECDAHPGATCTPPLRTVSGWNGRLITTKAGFSMPEVDLSHNVLSCITVLCYKSD
jgi:hypothetical protein